MSVKKSVYIYIFYIKLVTLNGVTIHLRATYENIRVHEAVFCEVH
jgi:hypothetical protein